MKQFLEKLDKDKWGKFKAFLLLWLVAFFLAASYGVFNDIITANISEEFYLFKNFERYGIEKLYTGTTTSKWALVLLCGLWGGGRLGILPGFMFPALAWLNTKPSTMLRLTIRSYFLYMVISALVALGGVFVGFYMAKGYASGHITWDVPARVQHPDTFILVDSIHNFTYLGAFIGLMASLFYLIISVKRQSA